MGKYQNSRRKENLQLNKRNYRKKNKKNGGEENINEIIFSKIESYKWSMEHPVQQMKIDSHQTHNCEISEAKGKDILTCQESGIKVLLNISMMPSKVKRQ